MLQTKRNRILNTSRVLREIWINKRISRIQIAKNLRLDKSTVTNIVAELMERGILKEHSEGEASPLGGRKPVLLKLNSLYASVLGIELRPESYNAVLVDLEGNQLYSKYEITQISGKNLTDAFNEIASSIREEIKKLGIPLLGIGVGLSGVINPRDGIIRYSVPLQIDKEFKFKEEIIDKYDLPLFLDNDANACAWGELAFNRAEELRDFIFLLVEIRDVKDKTRIHEKTAVGIGIVINGRVHYGYQYSAGEFRSVFCTPDCKGQFSLPDEEAFRIEKDQEIFIKFLRELSKNTAMIVNTFNLSHVFLGGDIEKYKNQVRTILQQEIQTNWPNPGIVNCSIRFSSMGDKAVAYGAAGMVLHRLFTDLSIDEKVENNYPGKFSGLELIERVKHQT